MEKLYTLIEQEESPFPNDQKGKILVSVRAGSPKEATAIIHDLLDVSVNPE